MPASAANAGPTRANAHLADKAEYDRLRVDATARNCIVREHVPGSLGS